MKKVVTWLLIALGAGIPLSARTQETDPQRPLLAAYVPPLLADWGQAEPILPYTTGPVSSGPVTLKRRGPPTEAQQWERFESEFGIRNLSDSAFKSNLQLAKYGLDRTVFAMDAFVEKVEETVEFEYRFSSTKSSVPREDREPPRPYFSPLRDAQENARVRSDVELNPTRGEAWIGMRLIVPFGN